MPSQHAPAAAEVSRPSADIHAPPFPEDGEGEIPTSGRLAPLVRKSVRAGQVVYDVGRAPLHFYRMSCGYVIVSQPLRDGRRSIVDLIEPGRLFGFCSADQHDCTATTTEPGTLSIYSARNPAFAARGRAARDTSAPPAARLRRSGAKLGSAAFPHRVERFSPTHQ